MKFRKVKGFNIFISNLKEASDPELLKKHNIEVVMTVCEKDIPRHPGIAQFKVKLSDPLKTLAPKNPLWEAIAVFDIAKRLADEREGNILVHCCSGNNRSALVPALWLHKKNNLSLETAVKLTQVKDNKPWMQAFGLKW